MTPLTDAPTPNPRRPVVDPRLRRWLGVVMLFFGLLAVSGALLVVYRLWGRVSGRSTENLLYLWSFLGHLVLGYLFVPPALFFALAHARRAFRHRNRAAVRVGFALLATLLVLLASGVLLTRIEGVLDVQSPAVRGTAYWAHVLAPLLAAWFFVLHRLAGPPIRWRVGLGWAATAAALGLAVVAFSRSGAPRRFVIAYAPSEVRVPEGAVFSERVLANDGYCLRCHADAHRSWRRSAHRLSSFNNPAYRVAVDRTREVLLARDGDVRASRFCAGCHDPVPLLLGRFDDPSFPAPGDTSAHAGITCTVCHAIVDVPSRVGNASYAIEEPLHYPFAFSQNPILRFLNEQLVKAKPDFHKRTFLKPLHRTPEFCGACHKVHIPEELNHYKWLRGQDHFDSFLLSGVSGHGAQSFYYPPRAEKNCDGCHMPLRPSDDFAARVRDASGVRKTFDHAFPGANTAVALLAAREGFLSPDEAEQAVRDHEGFVDGRLRVDVFGLRREGRIDGELLAPLRPRLPELEPGATYLAEIVVRTLRIGHFFTQGTVDSNQVWLEVRAFDGERPIGVSGALDLESGVVDPSAHFLNAFVVDREGRRIARRNVEDIFTSVYDHQIPPGAADTLHYRLRVPPDARGPIRIQARLRYRKFDTAYLRTILGDPDAVNDLPILELAADGVTLPVAGRGRAPAAQPPPAEAWERFNDYGIGLLLKRGRGQLRQAEEAFRRVLDLGRSEGALHLARLYLREGRVVEEAPQMLRRARSLEPPPPPWTLLWFSGRVSRANGRLDEAIADYERLLEGGLPGADERGFDFSQDFRVLVELGETLFERARQERGAARAEARARFLERARRAFERALTLDPENLAAHWELSLLLRELGDEEGARRHARLHARYRPDDNARDRAVQAARRRYPEANRAAEAVVVYDLRPLGPDVGAMDDPDASHGRR